MRIEPKLVVPAIDLKSRAVEDLAPFRARKIVIGEHDIVSPVSHPVHEAQGWTSNQALKKMIFDDDAAPRNPRRFAHEDAGVVGVMEHVDEQDAIERPVSEGQVIAVPGTAFCAWGREFDLSRGKSQHNDPKTNNNECCDVGRRNSFIVKKVTNEDGSDVGGRCARQGDRERNAAQGHDIQESGGDIKGQASRCPQI
jgi:hypothetical protein